MSWNVTSPDWRSSGGGSRGDRASWTNSPWAGEHRLRPGTALSLAESTATKYMPLYLHQSPLTARPATVATPLHDSSGNLCFTLSPSFEEREATWREQQMARRINPADALSGFYAASRAEYFVGGAMTTSAAGLRTQCRGMSSSFAPWTVQTGKPPGGRGDCGAHRYL